MISVSYIVSAFEKPKSLRTCLSSIVQQYRPGIDTIVVTDNSVEPQPGKKGNRTIAGELGVLYRNTSRDCSTCYHSADIGAEGSFSDYLCFPSDDSYYVPSFQNTMLETAFANSLDLVYCDAVYDSRLNGRCYSILETDPVLGKIDKTNFLVRREAFLSVGGFSAKDKTPYADGELIEALVKAGFRHGKAEGILVVHN